MDRQIQNLIDETKRQGLSGAIPDREALVSLLEIRPGTEEMEYLLSAAGEVAETVTSGKAYLWGAIGIDFVKCPMNCGFCSFGEKWNIVKEEFRLSQEEILEDVADYVDSGVYYIVLRTTEFYNLDELAQLVKRIRREVPGTYELILNVGEFDLQMANKLYRAGVDGIYHAVRLREGVDTGFDPADRKKTLEAIKKSPLKLIHLIEPLGPEHTNEEIADCFLGAVEYGVFICGTMARIPVKGTPLGSTEKLSDERIAHITAVVRLAGGYTVSNVCVHPASEEAIRAGANVTVIEKGAIPRDDRPTKEVWHHFTADRARSLLSQEGYQVHPKAAVDSQDRAFETAQGVGSSLDRFLQPGILSLLLDECLTAYQIHQKLLDYSMYRDRPPDITGVYRYTKALEEKGLLEKKPAPKNRTLYNITPAGRSCLRSWISTMEAYRDAIDRMVKEMGGF